MTRMLDLIGQFKKNGFILLDEVVSEGVLEDAEARCELELKNVVGTRNFLGKAWVREFAESLRFTERIREIVGSAKIPVQCTYFSKSKARNWHVPMHRDTKIPVRRKTDLKGWQDWSVKENHVYVQPPVHILRQLIAVRIGLEDNNSENGALHVIPGSHTAKLHNGDRYLCEVSRGGALIMSPLLLHASSKISKGNRRVLHFLYGPQELPDPVEWASFDSNQA